jgi:hypothetical protein
VFIEGKIFVLTVTELVFSTTESCFLTELPQEINARTMQDEIKVVFLKVLIVKNRGESFMFYVISEKWSDSWLKTLCIFA